MQKQLKEKFPQWSKEKQIGYYMAGTDDLDSQATQSILNQVFGYEQNMYVTREGIYMIDRTQKNHIGVDLACLGTRYTYDNHVTLRDSKSIVNPNSANVNAIEGITSQNYFDKCATSTLLQVMSLLDIPLPPTEEGKMFLLSIDSSHFGHYDDRFKKVHNNWLELLGLEELIDVCNRHTKDEISNMRKGEYLTFRDGHLTYNAEYKAWAEKHLGYEIYLPQEQFTKVSNLITEYKSPYEIEDVTHGDKYMFSCAFTGKRKLSYTYYDIKK